MLCFFKSKVSGLDSEIAWVLYQYSNEQVELMCLTPFQDSDRKFIECFRKNNDGVNLLIFYLKYNNKELDDDFILSKMSPSFLSKETLIKSRNTLKDMLSNFYSDCSEIRNLVRKHFFKKNLPSNSKKTIFIADVWCPGIELVKNIPNERIKRYGFFKDLYLEWLFHFNNQALEDECTSSDLFSYITSCFEDEVKHLYHTSKNTPLPFILPFKNNVLFPIPISKSEYIIQDNSNQECSLLKQREFLGSRLFNGNIYRITKMDVNSGNWELARSKYFDILDSSDYLSSRLKLFYQKSKVGIDKNKSLINMLDLWKKRLYQVISGDFSSYYAGVAFSIPTFRILDDGSLQLLCAKGSQYKATGNGKIHVCPAGMLEFWQRDSADNLSFEDFKSIVIKEFLEETVLSDRIFRDKVEKNIEEFRIYLDCFRDNGFPKQTNIDFSMINVASNILIENWESVWENIAGIDKLVSKKAPSLEAILKIKSLKCSNAFMIIDALNFRPEIVHPIYIRGELNTLVNWEYENKAEIITWSSMNHLEDWVEEHYNDWCAPGLAAAYLGARIYFEGKYNE